MTITIEVPETLVQEAEARGIPIETLATERLAPPAIEDLERPGFTRASPERKTIAEAIHSIRENRKKSTLGPNVTIRQLIEEGRRYP